MQWQEVHSHCNHHHCLPSKLSHLPTLNLSPHEMGLPVTSHPLFHCLVYYRLPPRWGKEGRKKSSPGNGSFGSCDQSPSGHAETPHLQVKPPGVAPSVRMSQGRKELLFDRRTGDYSFRFILIMCIKKSHFLALTGVTQWIEHRPANQRVAGLIPNQGTCLGYGPSPQ